MTELEAVLFDMDGLLVGTEETWFEVESEVMGRLGAPWGPEHQVSLVGGSLEHTATYMLAVAERPDLAPGDVAIALLDGMEDALRRGPVHWMPGARELLAEVERAGLPAALVSSSARRLVDAVLDAIGREHFGATVSSDDVAHTKPDPAPYRLAADKLAVRPEACLALEDSATGAMSARAAGCVTVIVPSLVRVDDSVADAVVDSLVDIDLAWLRRLVATRS